MPRHRHATGGARASICVASLVSLGAAVLCVAVQPALAGDALELNADDQFRVTLGEVVFRKQWVSAPASTTSSDGLGPLYNARACAQCHPEGARGRRDPGRARHLPASLVLRLSVPPHTAAEQA